MSDSTTQRENVLLFGLGGIGGVYACILALGGKCNVHVVARSNYQSVKDKGFRLKASVFGDHDDVKFDGGKSLGLGSWLRVFALARLTYPAGQGEAIRDFAGGM
jgi:hypothetical protein